MGAYRISLRELGGGGRAQVFVQRGQDFTGVGAKELRPFELFEIVNATEFLSDNPPSNLEKFSIYFSYSKEAKGIDSIPTSDILVDIEGYQYPVDPNEDINIDPIHDTSQPMPITAKGFEKQQMSDQKGNNERSFPEQYSTTCRPCLSTSEMNHPEPCSSFSDRSYFLPNPSATNQTGSGKQRTRGCRLWEFIRNLLRDPRFNPSYICWDNEEEGKFRIIKSKELARLWGSKKGNINMTFEKMSRAMRYYYKKKVLAPVLGKRLIYSFGPRADWKL
ncbi:hypothetical protein CHS0354_030447 [Potamilus streckersoni]|uniref:ETS domain-containing protein n=1 Tax=Potamilus streckersoni TaxID=2493646 RepID=A0AAE0W5R5_9BIVA|nr:hypothetical protein CHS0354_030447 [Potamilus streckersoni]